LLQNSFKNKIQTIKSYALIRIKKYIIRFLGILVQLMYGYSFIYVQIGRSHFF